MKVTTLSISFPEIFIYDIQLEIKNRNSNKTNRHKLICAKQLRDQLNICSESLMNI